jgi:hypothetical protein
MQRHVDAVTKASHSFINTVVNNFQNQMLETGRARGPYVHARAFTDGLKALKDGYILCAVIFL